MDSLNLRQRILLNQPHIESVSGDIANFTTDMKAPLKECKVYFEPIQEGEGDPSLDNVRDIIGWNEINIYDDPKYGGNIVWNQCFDPSTITIGGSTSSVFDVTITGTGFNVVLNGDVSGSGSRVVYFSIKWNRIQNHRYIFLCKIKSNTLKFSSFYIYHANGSSNRPAQNSTGQYVMAETYTGTTSDSKSSLRLYIYGIESLEGESFEVTDLMAIDLDMMFGTSVVDANATTVTERINWFKSIITNSNYHEYNEGEITTVSAINGDLYISTSISWANEVGTVYGGYLDLIKGEVVATYALFDAYQNRLLFTQGDGNVYIVNNHFATYGFVKPININKSISTHFKAADITTESYPSFSISNTGHFALRGIPNVTDTVEHFTAYVEEQMNNNTPVQFVMPLITPVIYQLTPQQLLTFKGENNIWSNINGQTEVKFWTH